MAHRLTRSLYSLLLYWSGNCWGVNFETWTELWSKCLRVKLEHIRLKCFQPVCLSAGLYQCTIHHVSLSKHSVPSPPLCLIKAAVGLNGRLALETGLSRTAEALQHLTRSAFTADPDLVSKNADRGNVSGRELFLSLQSFFKSGSSKVFILQRGGGKTVKGLCLKTEVRFPFGHWNCHKTT